MKLSNVFAKLTCVESTAVRILAAATLAGAVLIAAAPVAEAQHFSVGVQIGGPRYVAPAPPVYYDREPVYVAPRRFDDHAEWMRRQEFERHERFDRERDRDRHFDDHGHDGWHR